MNTFVFTIVLLMALEMSATPSFYNYKLDAWRITFGRKLAADKGNQLANLLDSLRSCLFTLNVFEWSQSRWTVKMVTEDMQEYLHNPQDQVQDYSATWIFLDPHKFKRSEAVRRLAQNCFVFLIIPDPEIVHKDILDKEEYSGRRYYKEYVKQAEDFYFILVTNRDEHFYTDPTDEKSKPGHRHIQDRHPDFIRYHPFNYLVILIQNSLYGPQQQVIQFKYKCDRQKDFCTRKKSSHLISTWHHHEDVIQYFKKDRKDFQGSTLQVGTYGQDSWFFTNTNHLKKLEKMKLRDVLTFCGRTDGNGAPLKSALHIVKYVNGSPEGTKWGIQSEKYKKNKGVLQFRHFYLKHQFEDHRIYYGSYHWLILYGENFELDRPSCFQDLFRPIQKSLAIVLGVTTLAMFFMFKSKLFGGSFMSLEIGHPLLRVISPLIGQVKPLQLNTFWGKLLFTLWTLGAFFLHNYYLGNLHSMKVIPGTLLSLGKSLDILVNEGYAIYPFHPSHVDYYGYQLREMKKDAQDKAQLFDDYDKLMGKLMNDSNSHNKNGYRQIYGMDKSAILLSTDELKRDEEIAPILFRKNYYKCKQKFWQQWITWTFEAPNVDSLLVPFRRLLTSGIICYWWDWRTYFYKKKRKQNVQWMFRNEPESHNWNDQELVGLPHTRSPKPMTLAESMVKVSFYFLGMGLTVAVVSLLVEVLRRSHLQIHMKIRCRCRCWVNYND